MKIGSKLRSLSDGIVAFRCPGCAEFHQVRVEGTASPRWGWNGDADRPTFTPSVLVTGRDFTPAGESAFEAWHAAGCPKPAPSFEGADIVCHSFVTDGRIQFLSDCTHALAGQTVDLPDAPGE